MASRNLHLTFIWELRALIEKIEGEFHYSLYMNKVSQAHGTQSYLVNVKGAAWYTAVMPIEDYQVKELQDNMNCVEIEAAQGSYSLMIFAPSYWYDPTEINKIVERIRTLCPILIE